MAGLAVFTHKSTGALAQRGLLYLGAPARSQGNFPIALKLFTKTFLIGSINRARRHLPPIQKTNKKHKNLTLEGKQFMNRSSFFLRLKQVLKAMLMGVVAPIDFFGQILPTQAYTVPYYTILTPLQLASISLCPLTHTSTPCIHTRMPACMYVCMYVCMMYRHRCTCASARGIHVLRQGHAACGQAPAMKTRGFVAPSLRSCTRPSHNAAVAASGASPPTDTNCAFTLLGIWPIKAIRTAVSRCGMRLKQTPCPSGRSNCDTKSAMFFW
jgi:hypothetical protein